jgi:hypothetical protein
VSKIELLSMCGIESLRYARLAYCKEPLGYHYKRVTIKELNFEVDQTTSLSVEDITLIKKLFNRGEEHCKPLRGIRFTIKLTDLPAEVMLKLDSIRDLGMDTVMTQGYRALYKEPYNEEKKEERFDTQLYTRVLSTSFQWIINHFEEIPEIDFKAIPVIDYLIKLIREE